MTINSNIKLVRADYLNKDHATAIGNLLNEYAKDPMGGGSGLSKTIIDTIAGELSRLPHAFSILCYVDNKPAGLANCFEGFSTFKCKPLVNIHDMIVKNEFRSLGISRLIFDRIEETAKEKGCCKITLEVLEGNKKAQRAYTKFGFQGYELDPKTGKALFWQKNI